MEWDHDMSTLGCIRVTREVDWRGGKGGALEGSPSEDSPQGYSQEALYMKRVLTRGHADADDSGWVEGGRKTR